ncbi:unnamed protein product [Danaus chrysippus]|uniref:(African queen) hypothetical protein n=1 Tax=Danaus chrysippus TaxID=151541 RepID=A0A8J2QCH0_9NEOP|nr:unnamed protein product [Danaus chrysippus]
MSPPIVQCCDVFRRPAIVGRVQQQDNASTPAQTAPQRRWYICVCDNRVCACSVLHVVVCNDVIHARF